MKASEKKALLATGRTEPWKRVIFGSPQSKANSRKLVYVNGKPMFIKSDAARGYTADFLKQCPILDPLFECSVTVEIVIYYSSFRPDVDESLILDAMQKRIYRNDRQVRRKVITGYVDADNPRAEIQVYPFEGTQ
jgi:Holliday junction resolvase RusA-like endonuclease